MRLRRSRSALNCACDAADAWALQPAVERTHMPRRTDLKRVLVIGSGPIVIGQSSEFDYSGTQACKALKAEGLEVVLINSNPATIMTDPEAADRTYVEPLTVEIAEQIIALERPDAVLPTVGGQTALNLAVALHEQGILAKYGVELIGAQIDAIKVGEDRLLFRDAMKEIGVDVPRSGLARSIEDALALVQDTGFPAIIRPSFTLGGVGGGIAYNIEEFRELAARGLSFSPVHEILIEESVIGWKEYELEVMRDVADNFVVICSIENVDPMGVHTGDSITVAPALTLVGQGISADARCRAADHPPCRRRDGGLEHPVRGEPGRRPDDLHRDEPARVAVLGPGVEGHRVPHRQDRRQAGPWLSPARDSQRHHAAHSGLVRADHRLRRRQDPPVELREVPGSRRDADHADEVGGRGDGHRAHVQGGLSQGHPVARAGPAGQALCARRDDDEEFDEAALRKKLVVPTDRRMWGVFEALDRGWSIETIHDLTKIDPWFLQQFAEIVELKKTAQLVGFRDMSTDLLLTLKRSGFGDHELAGILGADEAAIRARRTRRGRRRPRTSASIPVRPSSSRSRRTCTAPSSRSANPSPTARRRS